MFFPAGETARAVAGRMMSRCRLVRATPTQLSDGLELGHAKGTALVPGPGAGCGERGEHRFAFGLVNFRCVEILIEQHHEDGVPSLASIDGAKAVAGLAAGEQTTSTPNAITAQTDKPITMRESKERARTEIIETDSV
jgi:hypothetical protein